MMPAVDEPASEHTCDLLRQPPLLIRGALLWARCLALGMAARQVVATTAATVPETTAVTTGTDDAATAAAVIAATTAMRMTAPTPDPYRT